jgi:probable rRNA maturation factor
MKRTRKIHVPVRLEVETSTDLPATVYVPAAALCQRWAAAACLCDDDCEASLRVVDEGEMQALNRDYRGKDVPTNVLSFPMELPADLGIALLGDLALCAEVIEREAGEQHKTLDAHWAHMIVHGMLHLQGYDHVDDEQAAGMEALETRILHQLGFADPYHTDH